MQKSSATSVGSAQQQVQDGRKSTDIDLNSINTEEDFLNALRTLETGRPQGTLHPTTMRIILDYFITIGFDLDYMRHESQGIKILRKSGLAEDLKKRIEFNLEDQEDSEE